MKSTGLIREGLLAQSKLSKIQLSGYSQKVLITQPKTLQIDNLFRAGKAYIF